MFQYTVTNPRVSFPARYPGPVVIRTHSREQVKAWLGMHVRAKCQDRARYGLETMERRAAQAVQYAFPWARDIYSTKGVRL